jgi:hypothetical protein
MDPGNTKSKQADRSAAVRKSVNLGKAHQELAGLECD